MSDIYKNLWSTCLDFVAYNYTLRALLIMYEKQIAWYKS